jgi:hypothetical protein
MVPPAVGCRRLRVRVLHAPLHIRGSPSVVLLARPAVRRANGAAARGQVPRCAKAGLPLPHKPETSKDVMTTELFSEAELDQQVSLHRSSLSPYAMGGCARVACE